MKKQLTGGQKLVRALSIVGGFFVVVCAVGGIALSQTDIGKAAAKYESNKARFKQFRLPLTVEEYKSHFAVPPAENAGPAYMALLARPDVKKALGGSFPKGVTKPAGSLGAPPAVRPFTPIEPTEQEWTSVKAFVKELESLSSKPYCVLPRNWDHPVATVFPEFSYAKSFVKGLAGRAVTDLNAGRTQEAIKNLRLAAVISNWQDDEGLLIGALVRIATATILETTISRLLEQHGDNAEFVEGLGPVIEKLANPTNLQGAIYAEALFGVTAIEELKQDGMSAFIGGTDSNQNKIQDWAFRSAAGIPVIRSAWQSRVMESYVAGIELAPKDPEDYDRWEKAYTAMNKVAETKGLSYMIAAIVTPVYSQTVAAAKKERSSLNTLIQAQAAAKIRLQTGKYPAELPVKGKREFDLILPGAKQRLDTSNGFKIWNVGPNKVDDGGVRDTNKKKDDFVINLKK